MLYTCVSRACLDKRSSFTATKRRRKRERKRRLVHRFGDIFCNLRSEIAWGPAETSPFYLLFLCFSPEPVLANVQCFSRKWRQKRRFPHRPGLTSSSSTSEYFRSSSAIASSMSGTSPALSLTSISCEKNATVFSVSLYLSRACLDEMIILVRKWLRKGVFLSHLSHLRVSFEACCDRRSVG